MDETATSTRPRGSFDISPLSSAETSLSSSYSITEAIPSKLTLKEFYTDNKPTSDFNRYYRSLLPKEKALINSLGSSCLTYDIPEHLRFNVNPKSLSDKLENESYNEDLMKVTRCMIQDGLLIHDPNVNDNLFKEWINYLTRIGGGTYGEVFSPKQKVFVRAPFLVKCDRDGDLVHETTVGLCCLNELRKEIPNFMYIFGYNMYQQPGPYFEKDRYLYGRRIDNFMFMENITDSIDLTTFVKTCSPNELRNILLQVFLSLNMAYRYYDFTHYDLSTNNILIKPLPKEKEIRYETYYLNGDIGYVYLKVNYLAVIIDYGMSHIVHKGVHYGRVMADNGIFDDKSYPMKDIRTLSLYLICESRNAGNKVLEEYILSICNNFLENKDILSLDNVRKSIMEKTYHNFNYIDNSFSYYDMVEFINEGDLQLKSSGDIMNCSERACLNTGDIVDSIMFNNNPFLLFYETYQRLSEAEKQVHKSYFGKLEMKSVNEQLAYYETLIQRELYSEYIDIIDPELAIKKMLYRIIMICFYIRRIKFLLDAYNEITGKKENIMYLNKYQTEFNNMFNNYELIKAEIKNNKGEKMKDELENIDTLVREIKSYGL